jgi:segregation and condensation protein B
MNERPELTEVDAQEPSLAGETSEDSPPGREGRPILAGDGVGGDARVEVADELSPDPVDSAHEAGGPGLRGAAEQDEAADAAAAEEPEITVESVVEALLFATDSPLPASKIAQLVGVGDARDVKKHIAALNERYAAGGHAFRIEAIAKGYQMLTLPAYNTWVAKLLKARDETKLSPAAMEALAVVAYKQPVLRADIEAIRGVACGEVLNRLREMNMIRIVGRAEEPGRPMLYGTTNHFLKVFGMGSLADLPGLESLPVPPMREDSDTDDA